MAIPVSGMQAVQIIRTDTIVNRNFEMRIDTSHVREVITGGYIPERPKVYHKTKISNFIAWKETYKQPKYTRLLLLCFKI
jgi:hypothetical protein